MALRESPPRSKKLSRIPTFSKPSTWATAETRVDSCSVAGATYSTSEVSADRSTSGRAFRFTFPLVVIGRESSRVKMCGIMYRGNFSRRADLTASNSTGAVSV